MKKLIIASIAIFLLFSDGSIYADTDYTKINQEFTNFFVTFDDIGKKLPSVDDAAGTVEIIDSWTSANEKLSDAMESFSKDHPEVFQQKDPPQELIAPFEKFMRLKIDYADVQSGVRKLLEKYHDDPGVKKALIKFGESLNRVASMGNPNNK